MGGREKQVRRVLKEKSRKNDNECDIHNRCINDKTSMVIYFDIMGDIN